MRNRKRFLLLAAAALLPAANCDGNINDNSFFLTTTFRVSLDSDRLEGDGGSGFTPRGVSVSADGRFVAFESVASNLVPGDTNLTSDIFVHDTLTRTTERVSIADDESEANGGSVSPAISGDGRFVAFVSLANNLFGPDPGLFRDVYIRDRELGRTRRVSLTSGGLDPNRDSFDPVISYNGRFVAFSTTADNMLAAPEPTLDLDVFRVELDAAGAVVAVLRVSLGDNDLSPLEDCGDPSMSADGNRIAFSSTTDAALMDPAVVMDTDLSATDVYVRDVAAGTTVCVSRAVVSPPGGIQTGNGDSEQPAISPDGRFVVFSGSFTNLIAGSFGFDIYLKDLLAPAVLERVSVNDQGIQANQSSFRPTVSLNGQFVAYESTARNLIAGDNNSAQDVYVRDRLEGRTFRASVRTYGNEGNDASGSPALSADGRFVVFGSSATNLVDDDFNGVNDVFVRGPLY